MVLQCAPLTESHLATGQTAGYTIHRNEDIENHDIACISKLQQEEATIY